MGGLLVNLNKRGHSVRAIGRNYPEKVEITARKLLTCHLRSDETYRYRGPTGILEVIPIYDFGELPSRAESRKIAEALRATKGQAAIRRSDAWTEYMIRGDAKTVESLRKRAADGSAAAQYNLGIRHLRGRGVKKDEAAGLTFLKKSAAQDYQRASDKLKELEKSAVKEQANDARP